MLGQNGIIIIIKSDNKNLRCNVTFSTSIGAAQLSSIKNNMKNNNMHYIHLRNVPISVKVCGGFFLNIKIVRLLLKPLII